MAVSADDVEPIRDPAAIRAVKDLLADRPRDLCLFTLGINTSLRAGDLLRLTVNQVRDAAVGQRVDVREKRSGAENFVVLHPESHRALGRHLAQLRPPAPPANMYLFADEPGWGPIRTERLDELVRRWTGAVGLAGRFGAHTLRKTFGYVQRTRYGVDLAVLARRFHHPSPAVTARYLGLAAEPQDAALEWREV